MTPAEPPFNRYSDRLRELLGGRFAKLTLDLKVACPHRVLHPPGCTFCNPAITLPDRHSTAASIAEQYDLGLGYLRRRYAAQRILACFQSETATADPEKLFEAVKTVIARPETAGLIVSTRPDHLTPELMRELTTCAAGKPLFMELGLQSIHDETLRRIKRGHDFEQFLEAADLIAATETPLCVHLILGLPGESIEMMLETFRAVGRLRVESVKIHHLQVYAGTALAEEWKRGEIQVLDFRSHIALLRRCLEVLPRRIGVQRLAADAPRAELLAPRWGKNKNEIIAALEEEFARSGTRQGDRAET